MVPARFLFPARPGPWLFAAAGLGYVVYRVFRARRGAYADFEAVPACAATPFRPGAVLAASVPEIKRQLAAQALYSMISGEAQVLEELLDEDAAKHSLDYGAARPDGRSVLAVVLGDAASGSSPALALLLAVTDWDEAWDDTDEWNTYVSQATAALVAAGGLAIVRSPAPGAGAVFEEGMSVLRRRLGKNGEVQGTDEMPSPEAFLAEAEKGGAPDVLSFNTRVHCAHCGKPTAEHRCARCRNVAYCSADHAKIDAARHAFWIDGPAAAARKPCCVCDAPDGKHCTKCKLRHYCSKACQLDRLLDELMPAKLKIKDEPPIVEDVAPAAGSTAAARLPAARTTTTAMVKATALKDDAPDWRGTCAICLDLLPIYECCCKRMCTACSDKCRQHDKRCPLCRMPSAKSAAKSLRRLQKHVDKGNAEAQVALGDNYREGAHGLKKSPKRAVQLSELAAVQGHAIAQNVLGSCYDEGNSVKIDYKTAALWYRRAAEQGSPVAQYSLGMRFYRGNGVAQSYEEAVKWYRLAAAQGYADALYNLGACYATGHGVPLDLNEGLRLFKRAAAKGCAGAAAEVEHLKAFLAAAHGR
ncbi:hypothetical protein M885DRAFT_615709 [Pelagophyceae sp. CCMP2097]|nr:hypothetical protein M885DRAFT_615709 [Pelagophyceae sp. CCMP2097]